MKIYNWKIINGSQYPFDSLCISIAKMNVPFNERVKLNMLFIKKLKDGQFYRRKTRTLETQVFIFLYFWDEASCTLFIFFGLLFSSLSPCLSRCKLRPSSGGWNVELDLLFRLPGLTVLVPRVMFNESQLSVISC